MIAEQLAERGRVRRFETERKRRDGSLVAVSVSMTLVRDDRGRPVGTLAITHDITNRKQVEAELHAALLTIPNMTHPDAPVGSTPADNKVIRRVGEPRKFDFVPKDHVALAEALDLVDFEAGASVTGQKFYFLKNEAVLLELALVQFAMQKLVARGFTPVITPDLARVEVLEGPNNIQSIRTSLDYTLQLGSFSQIDNAQQLRDRLKGSYADVSIVPLQTKDVTYYRVQLGTFTSRNAAEERARQLSQSGLPVIIMEK